MSKKFPCPFCKGQGGYIDVVLDFGQGPYYECGICKGEGMIVIDGPIHKELHELKKELEKYDKRS